MQCPECQFENREDAKFCNECGHKFEIICQECNASNRVGSKFCDECGHDLRKIKEVSPINYSDPQSYTPKFITDKILTSKSSMEGERKLVTVLFADIANYTAMSEKLDPEEVHQIMDGCFKILMDKIHGYEGMINQFTGDGVMALFGAPVAHEDHAQRACKAALDIQKAMGGYGEKIEKNFNSQFKLRIGLNSGPVIVGAIGDDLRMDYTAVAKPTDHTVLYQWFTEFHQMGETQKLQIGDHKGRRHLYEWVNDIPLNGTKDADNVNYFEYTILKDDKVNYHNSWVTARCSFESESTSAMLSKRKVEFTATVSI